MFSSSTRSIPEAPAVPRHIAIIMDGNGRWAKKRFLPRVAGHRRGVETVRKLVGTAIERGVSYLTLFAFSSENWRRPVEEVSLLKSLFLSALEQEIGKLHQNQIRLKVIGDLSGFGTTIQERVAAGETLTANNTRLTLTIAASYGGRWDIMQATQAYFKAHPEQIAAAVAPEVIEPYLSMAYAPEPDLFIRTGGEKRISNFLLWQLAYTELHFTDTLWPDFDAQAFDDAIASYQTRERRFGRTSEQLRAPVADDVSSAAADAEINASLRNS